MLLQVLPGLSHAAVQALVDPLEEDHHGHEGFQGNGSFLTSSAIKLII